MRTGCGMVTSFKHHLISTCEQTLNISETDIKEVGKFREENNSLKKITSRLSDIKRIAYCRTQKFSFRDL